MTSDDSAAASSLVSRRTIAVLVAASVSGAVALVAIANLNTIPMPVGGSLRVDEPITGVQQHFNAVGEAVAVAILVGAATLGAHVLTRHRLVWIGGLGLLLIAAGMGLARPGVHSDPTPSDPCASLPLTAVQLHRESTGWVAAVGAAVLIAYVALHVGDARRGSRAPTWMAVGWMLATIPIMAVAAAQDDGGAVGSIGIVADCGLGS